MTPTTVTSTTTQVTIRWYLYGQSLYASWESGTGITDYSLTGDIAASGSTNGWNVPAMGTWLIASGSKAFTTGAANQVDVTGAFVSGAAYPGTRPVVTTHIHIPARPSGVPDPVTSVAATRNSDAQATITWVNHSAADAVYTSHTVQMATLTGSVWSAWANIASPTAAATTYVKTGLSANHVYIFRVRANSAGGSSAYVNSGYVFMTPAAPTLVKSKLVVVNELSSIVTTWASTAYVSGPAVHYVIQRSVNGGAYATIEGVWVGSPYEDLLAGAGTNTYRVAAQIQASIQLPVLTSAYAVGNTVATILPPLAPTLLSPAGTAHPIGDESKLLKWKHNPAADEVDQSHFTIQASSNGGSTWTDLAVNVASTLSQWVLPAGTLNNGTTYLWRVKTQGAPVAAFGPYSTPATLIGSARPVATLDPDHPADPTSVLPLDVGWTYGQDQGSPQAQWQATLWTEDGLTLLQMLTGSGTTDLATFTYSVVEGVTYVVRVTVQSGAGLWSTGSEKTTTVDLPSPTPVTIDPVFDHCTGTVMLHLASRDPLPVEAATEQVMIERRVEGGDWVTLTPNRNVTPEGEGGAELPQALPFYLSIPIPGGVDFVDPLPLTNGLNEYRVTSISAAPSYLVNDVVTIRCDDGAPGSDGQWVLLNWGDAFAQLDRFHGNPRTGSTSGRAAKAQEFLGRRDDVLLLGDNRRHSVNVAGKIRYDSACPATDLTACTYDTSTREWELAGQEAGIVCYRDYTGRRFFGMLSDLDATDEEWPGHGSVSFTVTRTGFTEGYS